MADYALFDKIFIYKLKDGTYTAELASVMEYHGGNTKTTLYHTGGEIVPANTPEEAISQLYDVLERQVSVINHFYKPMVNRYKVLKEDIEIIK